jgi:hypothetical protein
MHSQRVVFSIVATLLVYFGISMTGSAAIAATGAIGMSWAKVGAEQNLGVRAIAVNRRGGASGAASVHCTTVNNTAVAGKDFTAINRVISWANGDGADKECNVTLSDATPFTGQKTFYIRLSGASGAPLGTQSETMVTIYGNKDAGIVSLSAATYTVTQKAGSATITVNRTVNRSGGASVSYATANGTATAGTNYTAVKGSLTWGDRDTAPKSFVIPISTAASFTGSKTVAVALAGAEGANMGSIKSAIVTITGAAAAPVTGSATVSWTAPTLDTDGTPVTGLTGYNIYYGKSPTALTSVIAVNNPASGSYVIKNLGSGTWYFGVRAYNSQADESALSSVVSKTI